MPFDFACPDWFERLQAGQPPIADLPLDEKEADRAVAIYNKLHLPDVIGQPSLAQSGADWFREIVRAVFGSVDDEGRRQVGEVFCLVPKKNSKTTNSAAIALVFMLMNERRNADMLIIGPTQKISETAFHQARGMIEADPAGYLQKRFQVQDHKKTIVDRKTGARLMVRTFGMDVLTGCKPIFTLIEEVHILGGITYAADVLRQVRGGMVPFAESLLFMITTQSDHPPAGVFKSELQYARAVRDGRERDNVWTLPVLYEFPESIQISQDKLWAEPEMWHLVTPNLGHSIDIEGLERAFARAKADGDYEVVSWATQHLNVEVGMALHADRWVGADYWADAADPGITRASMMAECEVIVAGIDGGGLDDLFALALVGRHRETKDWWGWAHAWADPIVLERRKEIAPILKELERAGDLTFTDDPTRAESEAADMIAEVQSAGLLPQNDGVGLDSWEIAAMLEQLNRVGISDDARVAVRQGVYLTPAINGLERKLRRGTFRHGGQRLMAFAVGNAVSELRGNNVMITKQVAGKAKIDPLMALLNGVALMSRNPQVQGKSYLATAEMVVL